MGVFSKIFVSANEKEVRKLEKIADKIELLSDEYKALSEEELKAKTTIFKERIAGGESLDSILPEAYATVREASARVLGMHHFHVQLLGGICLHQGRIAQMCTGEGKTLVATLPAYLNALNGKGVHIVTVNDYLAKRDAEWMGKVYKYLGLTVGVIVPGMEFADKQKAYNSDITYATNNELGFDYLRDNMIVNKEHRLQRKLAFAVIDEVDSILIDEARTPLIISGQGDKSSEMYQTANRFAKTLKVGLKDYLTDEEVEELNLLNAKTLPDDIEAEGENEEIKYYRPLDDYIIDEKEKTVRLTEQGVAKAERYFGLSNYADIENQDLVHYINNALKATVLMKRDIDYVVNDGEIVIVDEFTGRLMVGRRYSEGLHQAIEAKENVQVRSESKTLATITFQNFFRLYGKLSGMTGTAKTEEDEFNTIYRLDVVVLPTNKPIQRIDETDKLYTTAAGKMRAVLADVKEHYEKGQPVLVGTASVEKSEELSEMLRRNRIPHNVLNAKNHKNEAEIIAQAGKKGSVTIATNMAGRGTDIMLGGNAEYLAKDRLSKNGYSDEVIAEATSFANVTDETILKAREEYHHFYDMFKKDIDVAKEEVVALGGLRIIGTGRHDSRRVDDQLRGRSGRQGDPGSSVFYLSMEDDMLRIFGGETMQNVANRFHFDEDTAIDQKVITRQIESAQAKIEARDFSIRKNVLAFDDVMNVQRNIIYKERNKVLDGVDIHEQIEKMIIEQVEMICNNYIDQDTTYKSWDLDGFNKALEYRVMAFDTNFVTEDIVACMNPIKIRDDILDEVFRQYDERSENIHAELGIDFAEFERAVLLRNVDSKWMDHIDNMHRLRQGIGLVAYGQQDPVIVYKREGLEMFDEMINAINRDTVTAVCKAVFSKPVVQKQVAKETATNDQNASKTMHRDGKKIGRNEFCPCGSGKKYKNCCGK